MHEQARQVRVYSKGSGCLSMRKKREVVVAKGASRLGNSGPILDQARLTNPNGTRSAFQTTPMQPIIILAESATIDASGLLEVSGWAVALAPIVAVQVFVGET